jgi:hypothetical protein
MEKKQKVPQKTYTEINGQPEKHVSSSKSTRKKSQKSEKNRKRSGLV